MLHSFYKAFPCLLPCNGVFKVLWERGRMLLSINQKVMSTVEHPFLSAVSTQCPDITWLGQGVLHMGFLSPSSMANFGYDENGLKNKVCPLPLKWNEGKGVDSCWMEVWKFIDQPLSVSEGHSGQIFPQGGLEPEGKDEVSGEGGVTRTEEREPQAIYVVNSGFEIRNNFVRMAPYGESFGISYKVTPES